MTKRRVAICAVVLVLLAVASLSAAVPTQAAATSTKMYVTRTVWVPCAQVPGEADGEFVDFSGYVNQVFSLHFDATGGFHVVSIENAMGLVGIGQSTDAIYRGTGSSQNTFYGGASGFPQSFTYLDNFGVIGRGSASNFTVKATVHTTVDANGNFTSVVDNLREGCE